MADESLPSLFLCPVVDFDVCVGESARCLKIRKIMRSGSGRLAFQKKKKEQHIAKTAALSKDKR